MYIICFMKFIYLYVQKAIYNKVYLMSSPFERSAIPTALISYLFFCCTTPCVCDLLYM